jgi:mannose-6-phosphate isomerase-like protein (cupin superfamily)
VGYTIIHAADLDWEHRREGDPRLAAGVSAAVTQSRANFFRYPTGSVGRRHSDPIQEEVFVVMDGTLTIHMGEDGAVEQHELAKGSVLVVQPGTPLQLSNRHEDELRLFIYGAPPERGDATFFEPVE